MPIPKPPYNVEENPDFDDLVDEPAPLSPPRGFTWGGFALVIALLVGGFIAWVYISLLSFNH